MSSNFFCSTLICSLIFWRASYVLDSIRGLELFRFSLGIDVLQKKTLLLDWQAFSADMLWSVNEFWLTSSGLIVLGAGNLNCWSAVTAGPQYFSCLHRRPSYCEIVLIPCTALGTLLSFLKLSPHLYHWPGRVESAHGHHLRHLHSLNSHHPDVDLTLGFAAWWIIGSSIKTAKGCSPVWV